jgi:hypothetical protein
MNITTFWKIIDDSLEEAEGDIEEQMEFLGEMLEELEPDEIVEFDRIFLEQWVRGFTWDLWAAAFIFGRGCSDEEFLDFIGWLICRGQKVFEQALKNPDSLDGIVSEDDAEDVLTEGFQDIAAQAWVYRTGKTVDDFPQHAIELPQGPAGQPWKEDSEDLKLRCPKLFRRYW